MSKEREILQKILTDNDDENYFISCKVYKEIEELLAQPEQESVYQKLLQLEDGIEVEILPSELWQDGYETGKRTMKPEQEPVAWMYDWEDKLEQERMQDRITKIKAMIERPEVFNVRPLYLAPPTHLISAAPELLKAFAMIAERNKHHKERHEELLCQGEPV